MKLHTHPSDLRLLKLAISAALVHAVFIWAVGFDHSPSTQSLPPSMEVILLQSASVEAPLEADYLANVDNDGGGSSTRKDRPSSPFHSDDPNAINGVANNPTQASAPQAQQLQQQRVINTLYSRTQLRIVNQSTEISEPKPYIADTQSERAMAIAKLSAEINKDLEKMAKRPRKSFVSGRSRASPAAEYMHGWVTEIERMGNLNYPTALRQQNLAGVVVLTVGINRDGSLEGVEIKRSSGNSTIDQAAIKLVKISTPFARLPPSLTKDTDILYITRSWQFNRDQTLLSDA